MDPACPPPMTTYLALDIQTSPGLHQQVYDAVVAIKCGGIHERREATLHHEWTMRGVKRSSGQSPCGRRGGGRDRVKYQGRK